MNGQTHKFYISRRLLVLSSILLASLFAFSTQAFAVDFMVNLTIDQRDASLTDGVCDIDVTTAGEQCSLRAAIEQANNLNSNDRVLFNLPANSTISLMPFIGGEIVIDNNGSLEIIGTGANNLTIDGNTGRRRIFYINFGSVVTVSGMTLTGGNGTGNDNFSGGGAIFANGGSLTLDRVHVTGNIATSSGGGVAFQSGTHRIINSTISNNSGNSCGGFVNFGGTVTVVNSTISGNRTTGTGGGGGICTNGNAGNMILRNVTITNNTAHEGGGIYQVGGTLNFGNTIVAGNRASNFFPEILTSGVITSAGGNLVGDSAGDSTDTGIPINYQPTDKQNVNPMLGALANNGGTTPTHALLSGSPLIDAGLNDVAVDPSSFNPELAFDQRGASFGRIRDGNGDGTVIVDIGAFERINARGIRPTLFDFEGDGKADISVFRPSNGFWYIMNSSGGFSAVQWGQRTDALVPGDYDGDGKTDMAVYRSGAVVGFAAVDYTWYIRRSSDNAFLARQWGRNVGLEFDTPVPADYDGDGKTDLAVYRLSDALGAPSGFNILQSSTNSGVYRQWGTNVDKRVPADYDGDGKADIAVYRTEPRFDSNGIGIWQILQSTNGTTRQVQFGLSTDRALPADYDGDGKADLAVYRPSNGFWYILGSQDGFRAMQFGVSTDKPTPADYDGDGRTDIAVFRPENGTWYLQRSTEGFTAYVFGFSDDIPIPNVYVR